MLGLEKTSHLYPITDGDGDAPGIHAVKEGPNRVLEELGNPRHAISPDTDPPGPVLEDSCRFQGDLPLEGGGEPDPGPCLPNQAASTASHRSSSRCIDVKHAEVGAEDPDLVGNCVEDRDGQPIRPGFGHNVPVVHPGPSYPGEDGTEGSRLLFQRCHLPGQVRVRTLEPPQLLLGLGQLSPPDLRRRTHLGDVVNRADGSEDPVPGPGEWTGTEVQVQRFAVGTADLAFEFAIVADVHFGWECRTPDLFEVRNRGRVRHQELPLTPGRDDADWQGFDHSR
ncbi:hypothetical protein DSECCO2_337430 [anaerobic digester metagenome]